MKNLLLGIWMILILASSSSATSEYVNLHTGKDGMTLEQIFGSIAEQTGCSITLDQAVDENRIVFLDQKDVYFEKLIDLVCKTNGLDCTRDRDDYIIWKHVGSLADNPHGLEMELSHLTADAVKQRLESIFYPEVRPLQMPYFKVISEKRLKFFCVSMNEREIIRRLIQYMDAR